MNRVGGKIVIAFDDDGLVTLGKDSIVPDGFWHDALSRRI
jgi:hypothetical protein